MGICVVKDKNAFEKAYIGLSGFVLNVFVGTDCKSALSFCLYIRAIGHYAGLDNDLDVILLDLF